MNEIYFLYGGIYQTRCSFSNINNFVAHVSDHFDKDKGSVNSTIKAINQTIKDISGGSDSIENDGDALRLLITIDLKRIRDGLSNSLVVPDDVNLSSISQDLMAFTSALNKLGVQVTPPFIDIVERFPAPFDQFKWAAFCPDMEDEVRYGIRHGIYLRADLLRPFYTQILVAHELIHSVAGLEDSSLLAMGLEEGIAELLGSLYLSHLLLEKKIIENAFIYSRHASRRNSVWTLYLDHARQALILYKRLGLHGLVELVGQGRRAIHNAEESLLTGQFSFDRQRTEVDDAEFDELVDFLLLAYPSHYVLPPLSLHLLTYVIEGRSIKDICDEARVPYTVGEQALRDVSTSTTLFVIDGGKIGYSNVEFYRGLETREHAGILRYEV